MATKARRCYNEVLAKVSRAMNEPFPEENALLPRENIMRRRDSACIMMSRTYLKEEFPDDDIDPRFMFDHPTIESMARSICGNCDCPYCDVDGSDEDAPPSHISAVRATGDLSHSTAVVAAFTQLVEFSTGSDLPPAATLYRSIAPGRFVRAADGMESVLVPAAVAWIGSDVRARAGCRPLACEKPCHEVSLSAFLMDVEPVSIGSFARFLNITRPTQDELLDWCLLQEADERGSFLPLHVNDLGLWTPKPEVSPRWPMILVSWFGANAYSLWANGRDWKNYRDSRQSFLPTEAQWEYAARGSSVRAFPWGDDATPELLQVNWQGVVKDDIALRELPLVDVNVELGVSVFGLRHMAGNVWQWCRDTFEPGFYTQPSSRQPDAWNCSQGDMKSERGGSWVGPACLARSSYRRGRTAVAKGRCLGFRCIGEPSVILDTCSTASSVSSTRASST